MAQRHFREDEETDILEAKLLPKIECRHSKAVQSSALCENLQTTPKSSR